MLAWSHDAEQHNKKSVLIVRNMDEWMEALYCEYHGCMSANNGWTGREQEEQLMEKPKSFSVEWDMYVSSKMLKWSSTMHYQNCNITSWISKHIISSLDTWMVQGLWYYLLQYVIMTIHHVIQIMCVCSYMVTCSKPQLNYWYITVLLYEQWQQN